MKTFQCSCGNRLFFDNSVCVNCGSQVGFCPVCRQITPLVAGEAGRWNCGHAPCGAEIVPCGNRERQTCNWRLSAEEAATGMSLCESCRLTPVIPDLSVEGNVQKWARLEAAKRRVLYTLRQLSLPIGTPENDIDPKLTFEFLASAGQTVFTGHDNGKITINIDEADDLKREKARIAFGEPQRTLVGHYRHELGHYYWDVLVKGRREDEFRAVFGDERSPTYEQAKDQYYQAGPAADWSDRCISAYASMHPWEDFAETFGAFLDMASILDTATHSAGREFTPVDARKMLAAYREVGILVNELNREMGLLDLVPEVFNAPVETKIVFIYDLVRDGLNAPKAS